MRLDAIMWFGIFLLVGLLVTACPVSRVSPTPIMDAFYRSEAEKAAREKDTNIPDIPNVGTTRDYDENGKRLTEYPGDPMAGTTKSRMYIENYERSKAAWAERHTSVVPQYALNYWEANHGSGSGR